ncbi:MAG TPA: hypothetical protein VKS23_09645 [Thermoanaerobaculia bacterium]|nr:hypothetical protein [Thermoanaerobaculia bacterium]
MTDRPRPAFSAAVVLLAIGLGCTTPSTPTAGYVPGLGDLMLLAQIQHSKLWFAGEAGNWRLASYELDELQEGFAAAARLHPRHKDSPLPIPDLIQKIMGGPMSDLRAAIKAKDETAFAKGFDALSTGCNSCHQATNFGFAVITRPSSNPYSNQSFKPERPPGS